MFNRQASLLLHSIEMAFCSIASVSVATGFVVKLNIITPETNTHKSAMVMFSSKKNRNSQLVVNVAEEAAATGCEEDKSKPPPIGRCNEQ
ncbi:hypothetical protein L1987_03934 [Smallanthus sonchifolius]|uniref:Uncharacterized protein n=1 Tax=Smallanthus sonchifolius TaxID=185202 RepID=A0ACB9KBZ0_9ASTR|nr:hypothetical protein L1987_03934 [Smallanthus sonchifolius]